MYGACVIFQSVLNTFLMFAYVSNFKGIIDYTKMLRLLKLKKLTLLNSQVLSTSFNNNLYSRTCSFCNYNFTLQSQKDLINVGHPVPLRFQSTNINTAFHNSLSSKKKKVRRSRKKFAELLEVTGNSTSQKKASVSKLKPKHLSLLVDQPDINLAQLHTLKKLPSATKVRPKKTTNNPSESVVSDRIACTSSEFGDACEPDVSNTALMEELSEFHSDKNALLQESDFFQTHDMPMNALELQERLLEDFDSGPTEDPGAFKENNEHLYVDEAAMEAIPVVVPLKSAEQQPCKKRTNSKTNLPTTKISYKLLQKEQMAKVKRIDLERAGRQESLHRNLLSYLDLCVSCGLLNRGLATLLYYRRRSKFHRTLPSANEVKLYNIILHGFAGKANIDKVNEIVQILNEDKLPLSIQSYAACFECIGRLPDNMNNRELLLTYSKEMEDRGFTFNDLLEKCTFVSDQRHTVLATIRRLQPEFQPIIAPPDTDYSCPLLLELNTGANVQGYKCPGEGFTSSSELKTLAKQQIQLELSDCIRVKTIEKRSEPTKNIQYYRKRLSETQKGWKKTILDTFKRDLEVVHNKHQKTFRHLNLYPYLKALEPEEFTEIILQEIRKLAEGSETFSPTTNQLNRDLGSRVQSRYQIKYKKKVGILNKVERLYEDYCDWYINPRGDNARNTREYWQHLVHKNQEGPNVTLDERPWPTTVLCGVGRFLYNIIMRDIKIDINVTRMNSKIQHLLPAFYPLYRHQGRLLKEELKPHPILARLFRGAAQEDLVFDVTNMPMLSPPLPWSSVSSGGYLMAKTDIIRLPQQAVQQRLRLEETSSQQLYPALDSLNQLGAVPWTVNQPLLDTVIEVFNTGGSQKLDIPKPPTACPAPDAITPQMSKLERYHAYQKRIALRRFKAEMYSLWCDALYRLSLANHFRSKVFWLPHNMDFRGRVYPVPPHLNHLGSDMARAILCFAKGEPLGPHGLDWLKIHLVNLTGLKKKEPITKRLKYANELIDEILDSAENPLKGRMWWAESEEPWQTLACCMEIARVLRSDNPSEFICHFPVHQDGSCNGLQHYAALGRDQAGAESVNLTPSRHPQDVYSCVVALVERERAKDALAGLKIAEVLDGYVRRKVIKQTVMTTVYGVTRFGARLQIARQLKDIEGFPKEYVWQASTYLVGKTFESLREMFTSTKEIQDWFTECARHISQVCGQNVEWVTPLGLPIVQPYHRFNKKIDFHQNPTKLQEHYSMDMFERPNVMKQKNAFPPNFIHSLDSSHMMLTSLFCERNGITFVSVHDCYWTHPNTVEVMNKICREQFVTLHSQPILEDLSAYFINRFGYCQRDLLKDGSVSDLAKHKLNRVLTQLPSTGNFQLESVLRSIYFFS